MTASVGQNFPGIALPRSGNQPSTGKTGEDGPAFDDLLAHREATGKDKTAQRGSGSSHWEKIRGDFNFNGRDRIAAPADDLAREIDNEGGKEESGDKTSSDTQEQAAGNRIPLFLNLHGLGRQQSDNQEKQSEPDTADAEADLPSADKAKRATVLQGTDDTGTRSGDEKPSPKIHIDQSAATRPVRGATTPASTPDNIASAQDAAISAGSTNEEAVPGDNAAMPAEPLKSGISGRASNDALKQSGASRATVSAEQNFPAPALQNVSQAARDVIDAIAGNAAPARAASAAATAIQNGSPVAVPAHILKIELHPAELGAVTANLRLAGEQLSIELKPDTYEAHRRLSSDSEAIVKSLKSLGFDIDKVTILQPSIASTPAARADAPQTGTSLGRDQSSFQPGNSSGNGDGTNGQSGRNRGDDRQPEQRSAPPSQDRPGRGLFI